MGLKAVKIPISKSKKHNPELQRLPTYTRGNSLRSRDSFRNPKGSNRGRRSYQHQSRNSTWIGGRQSNANRRPSNTISSTAIVFSPEDLQLVPELQIVPVLPPNVDNSQHIDHHSNGLSGFDESSAPLARPPPPNRLSTVMSGKEERMACMNLSSSLGSSSKDIQAEDLHPPELPSSVWEPEESSRNPSSSDHLATTWQRCLSFPPQ